MRNSSCLLLFLLALATACTAQKRDYRAELSADYDAVLEVSPGRSIWLGDRYGTIARTDDPADGWRIVGPQLTISDSLRSRLGNGRGLVMAIVPFNDDTVIACGMMTSACLGDTSSSGGYIVLRTTDGGRSWKGIPIPSYPYRCHLTGRPGEVIGETSMGPFRSRDYGATWEKIPEDRNGITYRLADSRGIILGVKQDGKYWLSRDEGKRWDSLKGSINVPPDLARITTKVPGPRHIPDLRSTWGPIITSRYIISRSGTGWYAAAPLGGSREKLIRVVDIAYDRKRDQLYGLDDSMRVVRFDADLNPSFLNRRPLEVPPHIFRARNGRVYMLDAMAAIVHGGKERIAWSFPVSHGSRQPGVLQMQSAAGRILGSTMHHVYRSDDHGATWYRIGTVHGKIREMIALDENRVLLMELGGRVVMTDARTGVTAPVEGLQGHDVESISRVGRTIIAQRLDKTWPVFPRDPNAPRYPLHPDPPFHHYRRYSPTDTLPADTSGADSQPQRGPDISFVVVSPDNGITWRPVPHTTRIRGLSFWNDTLYLLDDWPGPSLTTVAFDSSGNIISQSLTASSFPIDSLIRNSPLHGDTGLFVSVDATKHSRLVMNDRHRGWYAGTFHLAGQYGPRSNEPVAAIFFTTDGGATWQWHDSRSWDGYERLAPYQGGELIIRGGNLYLQHGGERTMFLDVISRYGRTDLAPWQVTVEMTGNIMVELTLYRNRAYHRQLLHYTRATGKWEEW